MESLLVICSSDSSSTSVASPGPKRVWDEPALLLATGGLSATVPFSSSAGLPVASWLAWALALLVLLKTSLPPPPEPKLTSSVEMTVTRMYYDRVVSIPVQRAVSGVCLASSGRSTAGVNRLQWSINCSSQSSSTVDQLPWSNDYSRRLTAAVGPGPCCPTHDARKIDS